MLKEVAMYKLFKMVLMYNVFALVAVMPCLVAASDFRITHEFNVTNPPGNIAVSQNGRVFMSNHFFYGPKNKIVEVLKSGEAVAYPNERFSQSLNPVLGVVVDEKNILWMLETAAGREKSGRLIGWDTEKKSLYKIIYLALPAVPENSFLNDLAVDRKHEAVYITDTAQAHNSGLIVVDLKTGEVRRVLSGSKFTRPENIDMTINGRVVTLGKEAARIGVNPITIDSKNEWLYFAPMTGTKLYRLKTADLLDHYLTDAQLAQRVETYADKPISDGITIDDANNIYISDITNDAIGYIDADRKYHVLFKDSKKLSWVDGFAAGAGNRIFATVNELHKSSVLNNGKDISSGKYYIVDFDALSKTTVGR